MKNTHVLIGARHEYDLIAEPAQTGQSTDWPVPKKASLGDRVFFFIPPTGFVASGTLLSGPAKGTRPDLNEPWASRYIAKFGDIRLLKPPVPLEEIRQKTLGWGWPTYPRSYTTVPDVFLVLLEELIAPRESSATVQGGL